MTNTTANNNGSASKRLSGLFNKVKQTLNENQQSLNNKNSTKKSEPVKSSTNANVKDFIQRVKSLKSNTGNNKKAPVLPPKDKPSGSTSNQIMNDLKKGANVVSQKVKDLTSDTDKKKPVSK